MRNQDSCMSATHLERIERLRRLTGAIPQAHTAAERCPDVNCLLRLLAEVYAQPRTAAAGRRMLQRDLAELVRDGRIVPVNPGGKPLRYRRHAEVADDDPAVLAFARRQIAELVGEMVPQRRLNALWRALLPPADDPLLDEKRLRILPDTLRLLPAEVAPQVLTAVIAALSEQAALEVLYQNNAGERSRPILHPQALVQRGPVTYVLALKNDEPEPVRFYALHRLIKAQLVEQPARIAAGFDLDRAIEQGRVDFGRGEMVPLQLRVRGYLDAVLRDCPLAEEQRLEDEPDDSEFSLRLWAKVPSSGALLRWLLAGGDNIEVVEPMALREVVATQSAKMAGLYG